MEQNQVLKNIKNYHIAKSFVNNDDIIKYKDNDKFESFYGTLERYVKNFGNIEIYSGTSFDSLFEQKENDYLQSSNVSQVSPFSDTYIDYVKHVFGKELNSVCDIIGKTLDANKTNLQLKVNKGKSNVQVVVENYVSLAAALDLVTELDRVKSQIGDKDNEIGRLNQKLDEISEQLETSKKIDDILSAFGGLKGTVESAVNGSSNAATAAALSDEDKKLLRNVLKKLEKLENGEISVKVNNQSNADARKSGRKARVIGGIASAIAGAAAIGAIWHVSEVRENKFEADVAALESELYAYLLGRNYNFNVDEYDKKLSDFVSKYKGTRFYEEAVDKELNYLLLARIDLSKTDVSEIIGVSKEEIEDYNDDYYYIYRMINDAFKDNGLTDGERNLFIGTTDADGNVVTEGEIDKFAKKYEESDLKVLLPSDKETLTTIVENYYTISQNSQYKELLNGYVKDKQVIDACIKGYIADGNVTEDDLALMDTQYTDFEKAYKDTLLSESVKTDIAYYKNIVENFKKYNDYQDLSDKNAKIDDLLKSYGFNGLEDYENFKAAIDGAMRAKSDLDSLLKKYEVENIDSFKNAIDSAISAQNELNNLLKKYNVETIDELEALIKTDSDAKSDLDDFVASYGYEDVESFKNAIKEAFAAKESLDKILKDNGFEDVDELTTFINNAEQAEQDLNNLLEKYEDVNDLEDLKNYIEEILKKTNGQPETNSEAAELIFDIYEYLTGEKTTDLELAMQTVSGRLGITQTTPSNGVQDNVMQPE